MKWLYYEQIYNSDNYLIENVMFLCMLIKAGVILNGTDVSVMIISHCCGTKNYSKSFAHRGCRLIIYASHVCLYIYGPIYKSVYHMSGWKYVFEHVCLPAACLYMCMFVLSIYIFVCHWTHIHLRQFCLYQDVTCREAHRDSSNNYRFSTLVHGWRTVGLNI